MRPHTDHLFAKPSFWEGWARIFDFGNKLTTYNYAVTDEEADFIAMKSDWETVGADLTSAMNRFDVTIRGR
jgi:hypothetical protein